ncbi:hypothetical protein VTJ83DRAFT_1313 [Remersonia thermophila]|uniref:FeS cluster biogenesis domain-containing protein n=1 Tax=Remersonia thermophila TaxID=72144 RepID=A0ABR4DNQ0_9PEZI
MPPLRCVNAPTTASLFLRLCTSPRAIASEHPILDLLVPLRLQAAGVQRTVRLSHTAVVATPGPYHASPSFNLLAARFSRKSLLPTSSWRKPLAYHPPSRMFTTSSPRRATHAIFNPQLDEGGKEMILEITPRAAKRLSEIMIKDSNPLLALRIQVESGGCHGFQYVMKLVTLPPTLPTQDSPAPTAEEDPSAPVHEDDTIFTYSPDDGSSSSAPGDLTAPKIILDLPSLELLKGSKVDFTMELIGSQFKIVDNPLATSSCGCGTSFDIKI